MEQQVLLEEVAAALTAKAAAEEPEQPTTRMPMGSRGCRVEVNRCINGERMAQLIIGGLYLQ